MWLASTNSRVADAIASDTLSDMVYLRSLKSPLREIVWSHTIRRKTVRSTPGQAHAVDSYASGVRSSPFFRGHRPRLCADGPQPQLSGTPGPSGLCGQAGGQAGAASNQRRGMGRTAYAVA